MTRDKSGTVWTTFSAGGLGRLVGNQVVHVPIPARIRGCVRGLSFLAADPRGRHLAWRWRARAPLERARVLGLCASSRRRQRSHDARHSRQRRTSVDRICRRTPGSSGARRNGARASLASGVETIDHLRDRGRRPRTHLAWHGSRHRAGRWRDADRARMPRAGCPRAGSRRSSKTATDICGPIRARACSGFGRRNSTRPRAPPGYHAQFEFFDASDGAAGAPTITSRSGRAWDGKVWFVRSGALTIADPQVLRQRTQAPARAGDHRQHQGERADICAGGVPGAGV